MNSAANSRFMMDSPSLSLRSNAGASARMVHQAREKNNGWGKLRAGAIAPTSGVLLRESGASSYFQNCRIARLRADDGSHECSVAKLGELTPALDLAARRLQRLGMRHGDGVVAGIDEM